MKNVFLFTIFFFLLFQLNAKERFTINDSAKQEIVYSNFSENLDSLINMWYIKNAAKVEKYDSSLAVNPNLALLPDSVYIERLKRMPSIVDLTYNKIVRNYIKVYTVKQRENVEYMLGMSDFYFPMIEEIFESYGLPTELKNMAIIESALNPRAVSRVGATGMWQFMYGTGRMYDLIINSYIDERRDPVKATHAAAQFIKDLYNMFNDWTLVIAAYNCGPGNVNKAIRRTGGRRDFWEIFYYLPRETRGYVPAYIAASYAMKYYKEHDLYPKKLEIPLATDTIVIHDDLHLKQVSEVLGIPLKCLRDLNPQYKLDVIPAKGKSMAINLPLINSGDFITYQDSIFAFKDSIYFNPDKTLKDPYRSKYVYQPPSNKTKIYYTVKSGDNLGYISEWFHVRVSDLRYWNSVRGNMIRVGQKLAVYVNKNKVDYYKSFNSKTFAQKQATIGKTAKRADEKLNEPIDNSYVYYKVKRGDTLWEIAKKYDGVTENALLKLNNMSSGRQLQVGQMLKIKKKG